MRLSHLHNIEKERHHAILIYKMDSPRNQRMMVGRCPCIGPEVDTPWVILKQCIDVVAALCIYGLDIVSNGVWRWHYQVRPSNCVQISQLKILNYFHRVIM